ncbi:MAG: tetratricopeptide repeat-containing sensor histidine kinase, partial [Ignavibacteriae bacterium]|nr:tetratricopeptide repeat-containing sensor histidine kinase [Ignavibacteriota bacterium]
MKRTGTTTKTLALEIEDLHQSARDAATPEAAVEFAVEARKKSLSLLNKTKPGSNVFHEVQTGYALSLLRLGIRLRDVGNLGQAEMTLLEALELYRSLDNQTYIMHSLHSLGMTYWRQLKKSESLETLLQALSLAEKPQTAISRSRILNSIGLTMADMNEPHKAIEYHKEALLLTLNEDDKLLTAQTMSFLGLAFRNTADYSSAIEYYTKSLQIFINLQDFLQIIAIYDSIGQVYFLLKRYEDALTFYLNGLSIQQEHFPNREIPGLLSNIGAVYHQLGNINLAVEYFRRAQIYFERKNEISNQAIVAMNIGIILLESKQYNDALQYFEKSLDFLTSTDSKKEIVGCLFNLGRLYSVLDIEYSIDESYKNLALDYFTRALALSEELDSLHLIYESHEELYKFHKQINNLEQALYHFEQYHQFETKVFNAESNTKLNNLHIIHQVEKSKQEAEFYRQLTIELSKKNEQLEHLNTEKNMFLGIAAHDLKNPLMNISMIARILADTDEMKMAEVREFATDIRSTSVQMFELIKNLLDVNAIESNALMITNEVFEFVPLVQRLTRLWQHRALKKEIRLVFTEPENQISCYADSMLTYQIMENLLSNAIKYSPFGTTVHVRLSMVNYDSKQNVRFEVQDEGPGITEEDKLKLFNKCARLSAHPTDGEHSTGLGLAIVKKIAEAMPQHSEGTMQVLGRLLGLVALGLLAACASAEAPAARGEAPAVRSLGEILEQSPASDWRTVDQGNLLY